MKPEELRIGNKVQSNGHIFIVTVNLMLSPENFKPIPLTEDWLLKFGFEKIDLTLSFFRKKFPRKLGLGYITINSYSFEIEVGISGLKAISIKNGTVHQLQNLYFALTGTELTIN